jgi:hypothetical protein
LLCSVPLLVAADKPKAIDESHETRRVMAEAADHALNSSDQLLMLVTASDRDRVSKTLSKSDEANYKKLGDKVQQLWKDKFKDNFNAEKDVDLLKDVKPTITGEGHDQVAVIQFPGEPGEAAYELHLKREKNGYWRINLPDSVQGATFEKNMMNSINKVINDFGKMPDDKGKAYQRVVTELLHEMAFPSSGK